MDIALSYNTVAAKLFQGTTDSLLNIVGQGLGELNIVAVDDQIDILSFDRRHVQSNTGGIVGALDCEGRCEQGRQ